MDRYQADLNKVGEVVNKLEVVLEKKGVEFQPPKESLNIQEIVAKDVYKKVTEK